MTANNLIKSLADLRQTVQIMKDFQLNEIEIDGIKIKKSSYDDNAQYTTANDEQSAHQSEDYILFHSS